MAYDVIIVGSGVSGSALAQELTGRGARCLMLEAGHQFTERTFPTDELEASSRLYWGGGIELDTRAALGLLRPKVVGGGSIVNQALADRFHGDVWTHWREHTGIDFFEPQEMAGWYERAEAQLSLTTLPMNRRTGNALKFCEGMDRMGWRWKPLRRAQGDCQWDFNDCIECLQGCRAGSKQSTPLTTLARARSRGLSLRSGAEVHHVETHAHGVRVFAREGNGQQTQYDGNLLVLAAGALGNAQLLLRSGLGRGLPVGEGFFTHPQEMVLALYDEPLDAFRGAFQSVASDEPAFREQGFKLENVFAPPVSLAMLLPLSGARHQRVMTQIDRLACVEVAVRDTQPGRVVFRGGRFTVDKPWNDEDRRRRERGLHAIHQIFRATRAREIFSGRLTIGLHLMGGCPIGTDPDRSVVDPHFRLWGEPRVIVADSSIFPRAPGQNPSLSILALSLRAARTVEGNLE